MFFLFFKISNESTHISDHISQLIFDLLFFSLMFGNEILPVHFVYFT